MLGLAKVTALGASLLALASVAVANPAAADFESSDAAARLETRQNSPYPVTGVTGGGTQPRYEIRTLYKDHPSQWTLYVLALQYLQRMDQNNQLSWFQIAGIHGSPNIPWNGVQQTAPGVGYCTHSINLFPTWHRPYVALFEQRLVAAAKVIAAQYPSSTRAAYQKAANLLRAPFWDWAIQPASGLPTMPEILTSSKITVNTPTGKKSINNPLYSYSYHPLSQADFSPYDTPWSAWFNTKRYPTSTASNAVSQDSQAAGTVNNNRPGQQQNLYNWFTLCPDYLEISNDEASSSTSSCHISLESLHNNVHVWVGGNNDGHMTVIPVSANDPTFMLHHAQIDRLFAMWQVIYPDSYTTNQVSQIETFTIANQSIQGPTSPLKPFYKDNNGNFWTSNDVRNPAVFHYTYPDLQIAKGQSGPMIGRVNALYGPNANVHAAGASKKRAVDAVEDEETEEAALAPRSPSVPTPLTTANNGSSYQYIANIATSRFGLNGSYTVYMFFNGPTSEDPSTWNTDSALVGSYGVFSTPGMVNSPLITTSTVALTQSLIDSVGSGVLGSLESAIVVPFLQGALTWRVATSLLQVVDPATIPDFVVSVVSSTSTNPTNPEEFPVWSPFTLLTEITHGKPGGLPLNSTLSYLPANF